MIHNLTEEDEIFSFDESLVTSLKHVEHFKLIRVTTKTKDHDPERILNQNNSSSRPITLAHISSMLDILSPAIQNNINQETINLMSDRVSTYNAKIYL